MKPAIAVVILVLVILALVVLGGIFYVVDETEQVVITQFGDPVGNAVTTPGLKMKAPFIQKANYFDKRYLEWDGYPNQFPTRDKRFIHVDTYARWRIADPLRFLQRLGDERKAQSRLDGILDGATRDAVARHDLIEVVRSSNRTFARSDTLEKGAGPDVEMKAIRYGREKLGQEVLKAASGPAADLGIEILDFRFKRINYVEEVRKEVFARMITERKRIAEQFRSEGAGEAARISGEKERELKKITSEAYRRAQEIQGKADAQAADIYAKAYNRDPEFYRFLKSMDVLANTLDQDTTLLLSSDGELLRYLDRSR